MLKKEFCISGNPDTEGIFIYLLNEEISGDKLTNKIIIAFPEKQVVQISQLAMVLMHKYIQVKLLRLLVVIYIILLFKTL